MSKDEAKSDNIRSEGVSARSLVWPPDPTPPPPAAMTVDFRYEMGESVCIPKLGIHGFIAGACVFHKPDMRMYLIQDTMSNSTWYEEDNVMSEYFYYEVQKAKKEHEAQEALKTDPA